MWRNQSGLRVKVRKALAWSLRKSAARQRLSGAETQRTWLDYRWCGSIQGSMGVRDGGA